MIFNEEEQLMYKTIQAIYQSGIPITFKGSLVLKVFLTETGFADDTRHTSDIDANWDSSEFPSAEVLTDSLQKAIDKANLGLDVVMSRMYGEEKSAGFKLIDRESKGQLFSMDMDVKGPVLNTTMYELSGIHFRGITPLQMLADKVTVVSSDKVFRRVKDVIDLYYFSSVVDLYADEVMKTIEESGRELGNFNAFLHRKDELQHAYEKFRFGEDIYKPSFEEVYQTTHSYLSSLMPLEKDKGLMIG